MPYWAVTTSKEGSVEKHKVRHFEKMLYLNFVCVCEHMFIYAHVEGREKLGVNSLLPNGF